MTGFGVKELQRAIVAALKADVTLDGLLAGDKVYDSVTDGKAYPLLTFAVTSGDKSTKTENGQRHTITIHSWSKTGDAEETLDIQGAIYELLNNVPLTIAGQTSKITHFTFAENFKDPSGAFRHGVMKFTATTQEV